VVTGVADSSASAVLAAQQAASPVESAVAQQAATTFVRQASHPQDSHPQSPQSTSGSVQQVQATSHCPQGQASLPAVDETLLLRTAAIKAVAMIATTDKERRVRNILKCSYERQLRKKKLRNNRRFFISTSDTAGRIEKPNSTRSVETVS